MLLLCTFLHFFYVAPARDSQNRNFKQIKFYNTKTQKKIFFLNKFNANAKLISDHKRHKFKATKKLKIKKRNKAPIKTASLY